MKRFFILSTALWLIIFIIPIFTIRGGDDEIPELPIPNAIPVTELEAPKQSIDHSVSVSLLCDGKNITLPLDEYLEGVVAAEMPALFPDEALRAQAVAARTYTMKKLSAAPAKEHNGAAVCNNPAHCKAYKPLASFASGWGGDSDEYSARIRESVRSTDGVILLYENQPITAVFHSTSSGKTERASDIWGTDVPYLRSVESAGDTASPRFEAVKSVPPEEFKKIFSAKFASAKFDANPENWFTDIKRSEAGGILAITAAGVATDGKTLRSMLGLNSINFTISYRDNMLTFTTRGYGHGVGMSQYGARAMALDGKSYDEILKFYYTGVTLGKISA